LSGATDEADADVGHDPAALHRLSIRDWVAVFRRTIKGFMADDCMGLARQVAFSSLLAFFPSMILVVGLLGLVGAYDELGSFLEVVAPGAVTDAIEIAKDSAAGRPGTASLAFALGLVGALWAASGAMSSLVKAVNKAFDQPETRPFWKVRVISFLLVFLTGLVLAGMFVLIVFGGPIGEAIAEKASLGAEFELVWTLLRWPMAFVALLLFFALVYHLAPDLEQRNWKWISPGSLVACILWLALSGLFALYTSYSDSYDRTYGTLAGGIVLLLWLYYSSMAILFGAELNAELDRRADNRAAGGLQPGS
jgi:membrane protein